MRLKIIINKYNSELSLFDDNCCKLTYLSCNASKRDCQDLLVGILDEQQWLMRRDYLADCQDNGPLTNPITPSRTVTIDLLLPTRSQSGNVPSGCTGIAP